MQYLNCYIIHLKLLQHYMLIALELKYFFKKKEELTFAFIYDSLCSRFKKIVIQSFPI